MIPFSGWLPDADPATPGILTDVQDVIPTLRGYAGAPSGASTGVDALAAACVGAVLARKVDGSTRLIAGSATKLYELSSTTWTDRTRAAGGDYASGTNRWSFAQVGDVTIATNGVDDPQESSSGAFANMTEGPKAKFCDVVTAGNGYHLFFANITEAGYAFADGVWWSALNDYSDFTTSVSTRCGRLRILDAPGDITAAKRLGSTFVVYKRDSMHVLTESGGSALWVTQQVPGRQGAPCQEAVLNVEVAHLFLGDDDVYLFDGSRPVAIGEGIRQYLFDDLNRRWISRTIMQYDRDRRIAYIRYVSNSNPSSGTPDPDKWVAYNLVSKKWGKGFLTVEATVEYASGGGTIDTPPAPLTGSTTIDSAPDIPIDSPFWQASGETVAYFNSSHALTTLTGNSSTSSVTTGIVGDDALDSMLSRVRFRFITEPTSATLTNYYGDESGDNMTTDQTVTMNGHKADVLRSARWHKFDLDASGNWEATGFDANLQAEGER